MSACTIDLKTARALCAARQTQTRANRDALVAMEQEATGPVDRHLLRRWKSKTAAERRLRTATKWARVRFVNGTTTEGILRCDVLKEWLRTGGNARASINIAPCDNAPDRVKLSRGNSAVVLYLWDAIKPDRRAGDFPAAALGAPITLTAPHDGGAYTLSTALPLP